ncbi:MAG: cytochrome c peroxidase [Syntrophotaleaceae bacterium]
MQHPLRELKILFVILALALAVTGCGGGGGGSDDPPPATDPDPPPVTTAIPTAPTGLPALVPDAGGLSTGFNVSPLSGTPAPAGVGSRVAPVPQPVPEAGAFTIIDQDAAIRLGKALFWDVQVGSDGQMACASCHFSAGADNRRTNTVHPGVDTVFDIVVAPGQTLSSFFTFSADTLLAGFDDRVGSGGVFSQDFISLPADLDDPVEVCEPIVHPDAAQATFGTANRLVTGRNAPTVLGAVFYLDNFWDGRASQDFNGENPLGNGSRVAALSSLASQATGPPLSDVEMSCAGRDWDDIGAKMVLRTPLAFQLVAPTDSVLGPLSNAPDNGLTAGFPDRALTYADLIAAAFGTNGLTGTEAVDFYIDEFANIWGQALQAYQATLIPNRTPYDLGTLSPTQLVGLDELRNGSNCFDCHVEPEFSDATVRVINLRGGPNTPKQIGGNPAGDQGFHNIGVSVTDDDLGRSDSPGGVYNSSEFNDGAFKTPGLRNLILTAPFMHNGSIATILDVLDFYDGQDQVANPEINPLSQDGVSGGREAEVVDFLTNGLLDCRVANNVAPFDHPELVIPNGSTLPAVGAAGNGTICP